MFCVYLKRTCIVPGYAFHTCRLHQVDVVKILHIFFFCLTGVKRSELKPAYMIVDLCISPFNHVDFCCLFMWGDAHDILRQERALVPTSPSSSTDLEWARQTGSEPTRFALSSAT